MHTLVCKVHVHCCLARNRTRDYARHPAARTHAQTSGLATLHCAAPVTGEQQQAYLPSSICNTYFTPKPGIAGSTLPGTRTCAQQARVQPSPTVLQVNSQSCTSTCFSKQQPTAPFSFLQSPSTLPSTYGMTTCGPTRLKCGPVAKETARPTVAHWITSWTHRARPPPRPAAPAQTAARRLPAAPQAAAPAQQSSTAGPA